MSNKTRNVQTIMAIALLAAAMVVPGAMAQTDRVEALEARVAQLEGQQTRLTLQPLWQNGLQLRSADGDVQFRISGRVHADFAGINADSELKEDIGPIKSGSNFRRGRLAVGGSFNRDIIYGIEYEFAGGDADFLTTFIGVRNIPYVGTIRAGRLLEFYSLEQLSSNNFHMFIERGLPAAFNHYWGNGIAMNNSVFDGLGTYAISALQNSNKFGKTDDNSKYRVSGRVTAAPVYADAGQVWMHLGAGYSHVKPDDNSFRVACRPESTIAPVFVNTGDVPADRVDHLSFEFAAAYGPASVQAEWRNARADLVETEEFAHRDTVDLSGYYVSASYFLTGENRTYNRSTGTLGRISPRHDFMGDGHGWGAWEVAARYSTLDLNSGPVEGGELRNTTIGVNWYWNPNIRVMANYIHADLQGSGSARIGQMRLQFDF